MSGVAGRESRVKRPEFSFEKLEVYQLSVQLVKLFYSATQKFPADERFALTSQRRRAATSISLNIAEGKCRNSDRDFLRFVYQSRGSLLEVISATQIAESLEFLMAEQVDEILIAANTLVGKINSFISYLERSATRDLT